MIEAFPTQPLFVTSADGKVHVQACRHLARQTTRIPATPEQVEANGFCNQCEGEAHGVGRTYLTSLEEAHTALGHRTQEARRLVREALDGVEWDTAWLPSSASYVALAQNGTAVAWFGKDYVARPDRPVVEVPWTSAADANAAAREDVRGGLCEIHFVERSVSGRCHDCDD